MEVNAKGTFLGTKAVIPHMTQAAVHLLAKSTAIQYAKEGIRANSVHPGAIGAQMLAAGSE